MTIPTNGLDFYLPFDADMDEKIHSLTGTLSSSNAAKYFMLSSDTAGNFLQCINTQGSNYYYLKYPGSESLMQYGTGDFSVSFWLRSPNWSYFMNVVFEKKYDDNQDGFVVYADGSEPVLDMRIRNQADHFTETYCNSSVFLHWCFVRVGTVGYWYCNGVLDSTTEGETTGSVSSDEQFKIGYSAAWNWKQAVFDLKALRIYNRALSDSEITELSKEFRGTSSLDTVLLALDGARDALVTAINAKGGRLADSTTLYQCADAIGSLSGGTSAEYYKCASVDTGAKTWSGYKAVQQENGGYTFEETVTTGLTYTTITPVVDSIYTADCMVLVGYMVPADTAEIPTADLFYYLPLKTDIVTDTGATTYADTGTLTFTTEQGIQCALFDGSQFLRTTNVTDQNNMTVSFWAKKTISDYGAVIGNAYNFQVYLENNVFGINVNTTGNSVDGIDTMVWHHYAVTRSGNDWTSYVDGVKLAIKTINDSIRAEGKYMRIGNHGYSSSYGRLHAYLTSLRIYYATLNESEILALAKEFSPTA